MTHWHMSGHSHSRYYPLWRGSSGRVTEYLVAPKWPGRVWFPVLFRLLEMCKQTSSLSWGAKSSLLQLWAWPLRGLSPCKGHALLRWCRPSNAPAHPPPMRFMLIDGNFLSAGVKHATRNQHVALYLLFLTSYSHVLITALHLPPSRCI